jgi:hypothetical protein
MAEDHPPPFVLLASPFYQKWVALTFFANRGEWAVARDNDRFIGQRQHRVVQRVQDLLHRAAGQVGAADGAGEQSVPGDERLFGREVEADAAFGVAGSMEDGAGQRPGDHRLSGSDATVNLNFTGRAHAEPRGLLVEQFQQSVIILVEQDGRARGRAKLHGSADVVDMRVGDDDLLDLQIVFADERQDVFDVIARVDDHRFVRGFVADQGAITLQGANREDFVDHLSIVATGSCPAFEPPLPHLNDRKADASGQQKLTDLDRKERTE